MTQLLIDVSGLFTRKSVGRERRSTTANVYSRLQQQKHVFKSCPNHDNLEVNCSGQ